MYIIHVLTSKKACPPIKKVRVIRASRRDRIRHKKMGISNNLPCFVSEVNASSVVPVLQRALAAKITNVSRITGDVAPGKIAAELRRCPHLFVMTAKAHKNNRILERLITAIGKATETAEK